MCVGGQAIGCWRPAAASLARDGLDLIAVAFAGCSHLASTNGTLGRHTRGTMTRPMACNTGAAAGWETGRHQPATASLAHDGISIIAIVLAVLRRRVARRGGEGLLCDCRESTTKCRKKL